MEGIGVAVARGRRARRVRETVEKSMFLGCFWEVKLEGVVLQGKGSC